MANDASLPNAAAVLAGTLLPSHPYYNWFLRVDRAIRNGTVSPEEAAKLTEAIERIAALEDGGTAADLLAVMFGTRGIDVLGDIASGVEIRGPDLAALRQSIPPGRDGEPGQDSWVPGPPGPPGPQGPAGASGSGGGTTIIVREEHYEETWPVPPGVAFDLAATTTAATSKGTPVNADELPLVDSAAAFGLKKLTWANLKATLKTYFDGIYATSGGGGPGFTSLPFTSQPHFMRGSWGLYQITPGPSGSSTYAGLNSAHSLSVLNSSGGITITNTSTYTRQCRFFFASVATAGGTAAHYWSTAFMCGAGGFFFSWRGGCGDVAAVVNARCFYGIRAAVAAPANVNPSSMTDLIGLGADTGDANLSIIHNDSSGTATKIPLGASFPAHTLSADWYELQLLSLPGSGTVDYHVRNVCTGATVQGTLSTDLPTGTTLLAPSYWRNNGTTALAVRIEFGGFNLAYNLEG